MLLLTLEDIFAAKTRIFLMIFNNLSDKVISKKFNPQNMLSVVLIVIITPHLF